MALIKRAAWVLVAGFALGLSWWSLAYVARSWGVPWLLSWIVSAVFDGVALICADLALRAARTVTRPSPHPAPWWSSPG